MFLQASKIYCPGHVTCLSNTAGCVSPNYLLRVSTVPISKYSHLPVNGTPFLFYLFKLFPNHFSWSKICVNTIMHIGKPHTNFEEQPMWFDLETREFQFWDMQALSPLNGTPYFPHYVKQFSRSLICKHRINSCGSEEHTIVHNIHKKFEQYDEPTSVNGQFPETTCLWQVCHWWSFFAYMLSCIAFLAVSSRLVYQYT